MWDRWALTMRPPTDEAPPAYTPRSTEEVEKPKVAPEESSAAVPPPPATIAARRVGYEPAPVAEQEVQSYGYRPVKKQSRKQQKKHDRMLILFWIPILFSTSILLLQSLSFLTSMSVGLIWALMHSMRVGFHAVKAVLNIKAGLRV